VTPESVEDVYFYIESQRGRAFNLGALSTEDTDALSAFLGQPEGANLQEVPWIHACVIGGGSGSRRNRRCDTTEVSARVVRQRAVLSEILEILLRWHWRWWRGGGPSPETTSARASSSGPPLPAQ